MKYFISLLAGFCLAACNITLPPAAQDSTITVKDTAIVLAANEEGGNDGTETIDTFANVFFDDFKAVLAPLVASQYEEKPNADTVFYMTDPGETVEGLKIYITSDKLTDIKVEEQMETYMAISTEEGLHELSNWKHGHTPWEELLKVNDSTFVGKSFSIEDYRIFPEVTLEEVKAAVKEQGGEEWLELIKDVKTVKDNPLEITGDTYFLRVSGKRKSDGKIITKVIVISVASGC